MHVYYIVLPIAVEQYDRIRRSQVQPLATRSCTQTEYKILRFYPIKHTYIHFSHRAVCLSIQP